MQRGGKTCVKIKMYLSSRSQKGSREPEGGGTGQDAPAEPRRGRVLYDHCAVKTKKRRCVLETLRPEPWFLYVCKRVSGLEGVRLFFPVVSSTLEILHLFPSKLLKFGKLKVY